MRNEIFQIWERMEQERLAQESLLNQLRSTLVSYNSNNSNKVKI
jgi:hypothetical protein